MQDSIHL